MSVEKNAISPFTAYTRDNFAQCLGEIEKALLIGNQEKKKENCEALSKAQTIFMVLSLVLKTKQFPSKISERLGEEISPDVRSLIESLVIHGVARSHAQEVKIIMFSYINSCITNPGFLDAFANIIGSSEGINAENFQKALEIATKYVYTPKELSSFTYFLGGATGATVGAYIGAVVPCFSASFILTAGAGFGLAVMGASTGIGLVLGLLIGLAIVKGLDMHYNSLRNRHVGEFDKLSPNLNHDFAEVTKQLMIPSYGKSS